MPDTLTPEQESRAKQAFAERRFDPQSYEKEIMGPELSPELQVMVAEAEIAAADPGLLPVERDSKDAETLAALKEKNVYAAQEFWFLDPADYVNQEQTSIGTPMHPRELLRRLTEECSLVSWFALASEAMIAKELNPRDVALAYRKIGENPENLHNMERWQDAISEIKQEESKKQRMYNYERLGLWVQNGGEARYVTWIPGCMLREFALVKFDDHGVPDFYIPGWRDVVLALVRCQLVSEDTARRVFGEAIGPRSRRYNMIMQGLRNASRL